MSFDLWPLSICGSVNFARFCAAEKGRWLISGVAYTHVYTVIEMVILSTEMFDVWWLYNSNYVCHVIGRSHKNLMWSYLKLKTNKHKRYWCKFRLCCIVLVSTVERLENELKDSDSRLYVEAWTDFSFSSDCQRKESASLTVGIKSLAVCLHHCSVEWCSSYSTALLTNRCHPIWVRTSSLPLLRKGSLYVVICTYVMVVFFRHVQQLSCLMTRLLVKRQRKDVGKSLEVVQSQRLDHCLTLMMRILQQWKVSCSFWLNTVNSDGSDLAGFCLPSVSAVIFSVWCFINILHSLK